MKSCLAVAAIVLVGVGSLAGCGTDPKSSMGFTLPDGNAKQGETLFTSFQCYECHTVAGVTVPESQSPDQTIVRLGGEVSRIKTYGELVTSIINPSHRLPNRYHAEQVTTDEGASQMTNYNDVMTVTELIDLVAFLQSQYTLSEYEPTVYPPYY